MISWRAVPLPFFRTQAQVILGLLVLAALDQARAAGASLGFLGRGGRRGPGVLARRWRGDWVCPDSAWERPLWPRSPPPAGWPPRPGRPRRPGDCERLEPAHLGLPPGRDAHGDAARSPLPDGPGDVDRAAQASRPPDGMGLGCALPARRDRPVGCTRPAPWERAPRRSIPTPGSSWPSGGAWDSWRPRSRRT